MVFDTPTDTTPTPTAPAPATPAAAAPAQPQSQPQQPQQDQSAQPSGPATAPANALKPSSSSQVHGVLGGVLMGALEGAARKVGQGLKKAVPYIPIAAKAQRVHQESQQQQADQQQDAQLKKQKAGQEATAAMDEHTLKQIDYNNATLTNHSLLLDAQKKDADTLQAQSDLAKGFVDSMKKQGIDLTDDHGPGHAGLTTQDAQDIAQGKQIQIWNGQTGKNAGVYKLTTDQLNQPLTHDYKVPSQMHVDETTGKLVADEYQTVKADGHNTIGDARAVFNSLQRVGVQAQTEFDQQQKNIKAAADAKKAGEEKPTATPKTLIESSVALVDAKKALAADPNNKDLQTKVASVQAEHDQIMKDAKDSAAEKHDASDIVLSPATLQGIARGQTELSNYLIGRHPEVLDQIFAQYPNFIAAKAHAYAQAYTKFTSGDISKGINSFNTALNHIGELWPHVNVLSATKGAQDLAAISGDKDADAVNTTKTVLADELGKAYKAGALTEQEHDHMEKLLGGRTPNELKNNIQTFVTLLQGKLDAYQQQWRTAKPDPSLPDFPVVSPQAQQVMNQISGGAAQPGVPHNVIVNGKVVGVTTDGGKTMTPAGQQ